ncbi:MAG: hypothetical protein JNM56_11065, partial [Planctomycetia bacterium]|nr:hypothetical protein [Planctomycetia bacterium]
MFHKHTFWLLSFALVAAMAIGCGSGNREAPQAARVEPPVAKPAPQAGKDEVHAHKPGAHGGIIVEIGTDNYHAEAVFEKGGLLRLYTLGKDEARVLEVETQTLTAYVKEEGDAEAVAIELKSEPQAGDRAGNTSQFVGRLPVEFAGKNVEVTVPRITIGGDRFRFGFRSATAPHASDMPPAAADADELYLKPGGRYTAADIAANGKTSAAAKFKGVRSNHNLKPQPGDKVCPVTMTK